MDGLNSRLRRFASEMFGVEFGRDNEGNETVAKGATIMVSDATTKTIQDWLARFTELVTKKTERAVLSNFFNRCVQSGYIKESPVAKTDKIKPPAPLPEILSLECVTMMLAFARDYKHGLTLPYFVLGCFCALRPSEIRRLSWDDIDIVNKQIDIHSDKTKTRARRTVDIPENAASWLELCQITGKTELAPPRRALDALKRAGGYQGRVFRSKSKSQENTARVEQTTKLPDWPEDALRHTAITYHYELHEHEGKTAKWAGNSPDVIHRHYKGRIGGDRKAAVAVFWGLRNPTFKYAWLDPDEAQVPEES